MTPTSPYPPSPTQSISWRRNLMMIWIIQFVALASVSISHPFIPLFIQFDLKVTDDNAVRLYSGLLQATFFICSGIMAPIWGNWADRQGRRLMVIRALIGSGTGIMLMAVAHSVPQLFVIRMIQGITGGLVAAAAALVASNVPPERMGYALGLLQTSLTSAHFVGPMIGGVATDHFGYRPSFVIGGVVCFGCAVAVGRLVREDFTPVPAQDRLRFRDSLTVLRDNPVLRYTAMAIFLSQLSIMIINPILPLFVQSLLPKEHGRINTIVGVINGIPALTGFLAAPLWGKWGDRYGHSRVLGLVLLGSGLAYAPQALAGTIATLAVWRAIVGGFNSGIAPAANAIAGKALDSRRIGATISLMTSARMFGGFVGPVLGGFVASYFGWWQVFVLTAILQIGSASVVFRKVQDSLPQPSANPPIRPSTRPEE